MKAKVRGKISQFAKALRPARSQKKKAPRALHSMLLALEPRMVFDASAPAVAQAVDSHGAAQAAQAPQAEDHANTQPQMRAETQSGFQLMQAGDGVVPFSGDMQLFSSEWSEPPGVAFNGAFTVAEDGTLAFGADGVKVRDPDSLSVIITISVDNGTLSLDYVPGVEYNQYYWGIDPSNNSTNHSDWIADPSNKTIVRFEADLGIAQQVLNTLKFTGDRYFNGTAELKVTVNDGYNNLSFTKDITVTPLPNAPIFPGLPSDTSVGKVYEDTPAALLFNYKSPPAESWEALKIGDPDSSDATFYNKYDLALSITKGTLSSSYRSLGAGTEAGGVITYTLNGLTLDQANSVLAGLSFLGEQNYYGKADLTVRVTDLEPGLAGNTLSRTFEIDVLAVNDAPTLSPADANDRANQLRVYETDNGSGKSNEDIFTLKHFNIDYAGQSPDSDGNIRLFDVDNNLYQLVVRVDATPDKGELWRKIGNDWVKLGAGSTFSLMDVYEGRVKYVHDAAKQVREETYAGSGSDSFNFTVNDGAGGTQSGTMHIALEPINQAPSIVVGAGGPISSDRLDSRLVTDPETGALVYQYTIWAYEGEQGIVYSFNIKDPDQAPGADFKVKFTQLPPSDLGSFWYNTGGSTWVKVDATNMATLELSLATIQAGGLRFNHSGKESGGNVSFKISVTDDGGGEGEAGKKTVEQAMTLNIRANNDHPEWSAVVPADGTNLSPYDKWNNPEHTYTHVSLNGSHVVQLTNSILKLTDKDSVNDGLTYTITGFDGSAGKLLYKVGTEPDGEGGTRNVYREIRANDKITQADVNSGNIYWWFNQSGPVESSFTFTVRDGSMTAVPVPADSETNRPWPFNGPSPTDWEKGSGAHEGGIGTWVETSPDHYQWVLTTHTLVIQATVDTGGDGTSPGTATDPVPHFDATSAGTVVEGQWLKLDKTMLHAWFTDGNNPANITDQPGCLSATGSNLTYRVEGTPLHGTLLYLTGGTGPDDPSATFAVIGHCGSFTQADVDAGRIFYLHDSSENFTDSFKFSVSDGRHQVVNTQTNDERFTQNFQIRPRNDSPEARVGKDLEVYEHGLPAGQSADHTTPGGIKALTLEQLNIYDRDTGSLGAALDPGGYSTPNGLYILITELPKYGTLQYYDGSSWVNVVAVASESDRDSIMLGAGWAGWASDPLVAGKGVTIISRQDIVDGKFRYQHNGTEQFYDGFKYLVSDNKGIASNSDPSNTAHNSYSLIDNRIVLNDGNQASVSGPQGVNIIIKPVNDIPESVHDGATPPAVVRVDENGSVTLKGSAVNGVPIAKAGSNIWFVDPDGSPSAIQFKITELPQYGQITLNGKVLGVGSVFTQADLDAGRVSYKHDGTENHTDSFKFTVSDSVYTSTTPETVHIDVTPVNKAPTLTIPNDQLYVDSLVGGVIINGITILDPDYAGRTGAEYPGSGIVTGQDHLTVEIKLSQGDSGGIDLDKVEVLFKGGGAGLTSLAYDAVTDTYTLIGAYEAIREALSEVTMRAKTVGGTTYDPNGDIRLKVTVHDGIYAAGSWVQPNGGKGVVYDVSRDIRVYISPLNDPPKINNAQMSRSLGEDSDYVPVKAGGTAIQITDKDAFNRGGNSITLSVEHGKLMVDVTAGVGITGRGSNTVTITGTIDAINAALATLQYKPDANYNGPDLIRYTYKDYGNSGDAPLDVTKTKADNPALGEPYRYGEDAVGNRPARTGLAVDGEFALTVDPVNDPPAVEAPTAIYLRGNSVFNGGADLADTPLRISVGDIDITGPGTLPGDNTITVKISVISGSLSLDGTPPSGLDSVSGGGTGILTLKGTLEAVNNALEMLKYSRTNWDPSTDTMTIKVTDPGTSPNQSNGAPNDAPLEAIKRVDIYCSASNNAPVVTAPAWTAKEDDGAAKIFTGVTLTDTDSFNNKIYVSLRVDSGTLDITDAKALLKLSGGNPALWDAIAVVNNNGVDAKDGQTVQFHAERSKIELAIAQLLYKPVADFNGTVNVSIYINDLGNTGAPPADTALLRPVPANTVGANGEGCFSSKDTTIAVTAVNDAPSSSAAAANFWGSDADARTSGDFEDTRRDADNWTQKTVNDVFGGLFRDTKDERDANAKPVGTAGAAANAFAGVVIVGNTAAADQGVWQYHNGTDWVDIGSRTLGTALYLDKTTEIRFVPSLNFNGTPGALSVRMVDASVADAANGNPGKPGTNYSVHDLSGAGKTGGNTCFAASDVTLNTFVRAVNDAPVVKTPGTPVVLAAVNEDATNPGGSTIPALFGGKFDDATDNQKTPGGSDASGADTLAGVVVTGNAATADQGVWQYKNGSSWVDLPGGLSESNGLFLPSASSLRFLPATNWNGAPGSLTVHLVDGSATDTAHGNAALPAAFSRVNLTDTGVDPKDAGGTTRYSVDTVTLNTSVTAVNDAPVVVNGNSVTLDTIAEGPANDSANPGKTVTDLFASHFNDDTDTVAGGSGANAFAGVLVVGNAAPAAQGTWQYHDGVSWKDIPVPEEGQGFALKETWALRFNPADDFNGEPGKLTVRLIDSSATVSGNPAASYGAAVIITATGDVTRYSAGTIEAGISVTAVNDAPKVTSPATALDVPPLPEDIPAASNNGHTVADLFTARFDDSKDAQSAFGGSSANILAGIVVDALPTGAQAAKGAWQYYDGALSQWTNLETGMFIKSTDKIRFQPNDGSDYNGTVTGLKVKLVENSGAFADPAAHASGEEPGLTHAADGPLSQDALAVNIKVNAVNDAPVALNPQDVINYPAINEDGAVPGEKVSDLFGGRFSDMADDRYNAASNPDGSQPNTLAGIIVQSVTNDAAKGAWQYYDGTQWNNLAVGMFVGKDTKIRFQPQPDWNGTPPDLKAYLVENSGAYAGASPPDGSQADASQRGGTTPVSTDALTLHAVVQAVNDAPFWNPDAYSPNGTYLDFTEIAYVAANPGSEYSAEKTVEQALYGTNGAHAYLDARDDVTGGSSAQELRGVLVTGVSNAALGTWQYYNGTSWVDIGGVSESNALYLSKDTQIRFKYDTSYTTYVTGYSNLSLALVDSSSASNGMTTGDARDVSGTNRGGTTPFSGDIVPLTATVAGKNSYPEFTANPAPVTATERTPQQLAPTVVIKDYNLDSAQCATQWGGASVTISRDGGANAEDVFSSHDPGVLSELTEGSALEYNGTVYGTVAKNSGGTLTLTFNGSATAAEVNAILQNIDYTNASHTPSPSIGLRWTVDDGNYARNGAYPQGPNDGNDRSGTVSTVQTITITPVNDPPVAVDDTALLDVQKTDTVSGNVLDNDWDWEGDTLTAIPGTATGTYGTLELNADGTWTYTVDMTNPDVIALRPGESLTETFTYTVSDGSLTDTAELTITITPKNLPPVAVDDAATLDSFASTSSSGNVLGNDSDPDGDPITVTGHGAARHGSLVINPDGSWTYTLNADDPAVKALIPGQKLSEEIFYSISDGKGGTASARLVIDISPSNRPPVAVDDTVVVNAAQPEPLSGNVLNNDTDPDGDPLKVTAHDAARHGSLVLNPDGTWTYTLNAGDPAVAALIPGQTLSEEITYTISDGKGGSASAKLIISITMPEDGGTPGNHPPLAVDDAASVNASRPESLSDNVLGNDSDPDGDPLTVTEHGAAQYGNLVLNPDGSWSYTLDMNNPAVAKLPPGGTLSEEVSYTVSDGKGGTSTAKLVITITMPDDPQNTPPLAADDASTLNTGGSGALSGNVLRNDSDPDGDPLRVINYGAALYGDLVINPDGTWSYALHKDHPAVAALTHGQSLTEEIAYTVSDGRGGTATAVLRLTLLSGDDPVRTPVTPGIPPAVPAPAALPDNPHDLAVFKPVVLEVAVAREAMATSISGGLARLRDTLHDMGTGQERQHVSLTGSLDDGEIRAGYSQTLNLPRDLFRHSNPNEQLTFTVTLEDGRPLPAWLTWNSETMSFTGKPERALDSPLVIKIVARDRSNNSAATLFRLNVTDTALDPAKPAGQEKEEPAPASLTVSPEQESGEERAEEGQNPPGATGLSGQIAQSGMRALFLEARETIHRLYG